MKKSNLGIFQQYSEDIDGEGCMYISYPNFEKAVNEIVEQLSCSEVVSPAKAINSDCNDLLACQNTDIEIWRKVKDDYYSPSIHVTKDGNVGIAVGGHVLVAPVEEWHKAGNKLFTVNTNLKNC